MKAALTRLFQHETLDRATACALLKGIATEAYNDVQVASFVTVFQMRAITTEELQGFRDALLELAVPLDIGGRTTIDIVGTGGDGKDTFNLSTTAALVVAGAGYAVTKHGSYGVSSSVGSSDVLLALGYTFTNESDTLLRQLERANICFLHAPLFHPALKAVVPVRRQLGMQTFFNMLGPLVNPVQPTHQLLGTYSPALARLYHYIMEASGRAYTIIHALDGYDEVSLTDAVRAYRPNGESVLWPKDFGYEPVAPEALYGGETADDARRILLAVLENKATPAQQAAVCANAGLAIQTLHPEKSLIDAVAEARESIASGRARKVLERCVLGV